MIATAFPYDPHYVDILGSKMHYIESGEGSPVLFLHGVPTWSYLWRNVLPHLSGQARCIAVDFIGMGKSDKPQIDYSVADHLRYLTAFIEALDLQNITLVMHGWGSVIGFEYARQHPDKIKALACLESHIRPATDWAMVSLPVQELASVLDSADGGYDVIMHSNYYVNKVLPSGVLRPLSDDEMAQYQQPFSQPGSCRPIWQYLQELPLGESTSPVLERIAEYSTFLTQSPLPKLMLYAVPGFVTTMETVQWAKANLPNLTLVDIGEALHYAPESNPDKIGQALSEWYQALD